MTTKIKNKVVIVTNNLRMFQDISVWEHCGQIEIRSRMNLRGE
jgi:hypothetical protein